MTSGTSSASATPGPIKIQYGQDSSQWGELHLPTGTRNQGTVVIIHGGFWLSEYGAELGTPLAADLATRGWVVWNLEYRRVGDGGGWPATLQDVATGIDKLTDIAGAGKYGSIDVDHVVAIGHSAGGQLAAWLAARQQLAAGAPGAIAAGAKRAVAVTGVVSQAGVLDLTVAAATGVGGSSVPDLLGGTVEQHPDRYEIADPIKHLPLGVPLHCVQSKDDGNVPYSQSTAYVAAATKAGDTAELHTVAGDHFTLIDPTSAAWAVVVDLLPKLCGT
ncbi:MAG: alpha/beta hydrolase family protein [Nakamurella sp.]